jgi:hypothetical protein
MYLPPAQVLVRHLRAFEKRAEKRKKKKEKKKNAFTFIGS